jgi:hypothetical protein
VKSLSVESEIIPDNVDSDLHVYLHIISDTTVSVNYNRVRVMEFNSTINNISAISWQSVLLEEETGVPREDH